MPSEALVLGFDTSAAHCAAALLSGERLLAARAEEMGRGQAERLIPLIEEVLAEAGHGWAELRRIGCGTGPGNFTGIRISVAAARGLALSLGIPAVGVTTFEAIRLADPDALAAVPAPRGQVYLARPGAATELVAAEDAGEARFPPPPAEMARAIAAVAARSAAHTPPAPLYLRAADAAPPRDAPPEIIDDL